MEGREAVARLREALRDDLAVEGHAPVEIEGAKLELTLVPRGGEALARALRLLSELDLAVLPRGGGAHQELGNPPRRAAALLSTAALGGILELDAGEGVCRAGAGTPLAALRAAVNAEGWELPLDAPGAGATLGGVLACAAQGPRAQGFGRPRDAVLGLEVALATGERTRCGGRVVKNVTGYDLAKLYLGSLGSLGVIEAAWLRLRPRPGSVACLEAELPGPGAAGVGAALSAARRASARAAVLELAAAESPARLLVELAGAQASVARDARWLEAELGAREVPPAALDSLRRPAPAPPGSSPLRLRLGARPSRLAQAAELLLGAGARVRAQPGLGILEASFALPAGADAGAALSALGAAERAAALSGGLALIEAAPLAVKAGRDVFGAQDPAVLALSRALKAQFDPRGVLNPGRFAGGL
jgi:glycolate oxidase FAD binding subunit